MTKKRNIFLPLLYLAIFFLYQYSQHLNRLQSNLSYSLAMALCAIGFVHLVNPSFQKENKSFRYLVSLGTALFAFSGNLLYNLEIDHQMATQNQVTVYPIFAVLIILPAILVYLLNRHQVNRS